MANTRESRAELRASRFDAVLFDMDGVVTQTATVHAASWKRAFDELLGTLNGPGFQPFDVEADYRLYVDGKPRYDGVVSFLASRGISLPYGSPEDPPDRQTVCGVGNRKEAYFQEVLATDGVQRYESTIDLIRALKAAGIKTGIFTASRNAVRVLQAADALGLFDARVDGVDAAGLGLPGKPDPATLLELARRLDVEPARSAVVEDAIAGVAAGKAGNFGLVIGVNRGTKRGELLAHGADVEVADLSEVTLQRGS